MGRGPLIPAALSPGAEVAVVAPAGPVDRDRFDAGVAHLAGRYDLRWDEALFSREGFLAGSDGRRADELNRAFADPSVRGILCARGGYGLTRILGRLDLAALARDPKPLVGFSDVTALHAACLRAGVATVHGPVLIQLPRLEEPVEELFRVLEKPGPAPPWDGLLSVAGGVAAGRAVGGNLEVLTRLLGTPWMPDLDGAVLFIEDVGERPYRVDRALTHLRTAGALEPVAAVVVGELTGCVEPEPGDGSVVEAVIAERLADLGVPVVTGAPFGHGTRNRPFGHGLRVRVDGDEGTVHFLDAAVR